MAGAGSLYGKPCAGKARRKLGIGPPPIGVGGRLSVGKVGVGKVAGREARREAAGSR